MSEPLDDNDGVIEAEPLTEALAELLMSSALSVGTTLFELLKVLLCETVGDVVLVTLWHEDKVGLTEFERVAEEV